MCAGVAGVGMGTVVGVGVVGWAGGWDRVQLASEKRGWVHEGGGGRGHVKRRGRWVAQRDAGSAQRYKRAALSTRGGGGQAAPYVDGGEGLERSPNPQLQHLLWSQQAQQLLVGHADAEDLEETHR